MPRVLSSRWTVWYRSVLPGLWLTVFGAVSIGMLSARPPGWPIFPAVFVLGGIFWYWICGRLKKVVLDGDDLIVSSVSREIRVPLRRITSVTASRMTNPPRITLKFDGDIGFGRSVIFMPPTKFLWPFQEHPMAEELREIVRMSHQSSN